MMKTPVTTTTIARNPFSIPNSLFSRQTFHIIPSINLPLVAAVKCSKNENPGIGNENGNGNGGSLKNILSGMVNESVIDELLNKEENRVLLDGLEQASRRVEIAKRNLAEIEKQEIEAKIMRDYINQLESKASEIEECQKEISEARAMVEEAERSLTVTDSSSSSSERFQSVKAASVSAVIGTLVQIPISLTRVTTFSQLILPLSITFVTCALFGVTFRYAIRRDLDNFQLKSGTSAAFAFVKGLGMLGAGTALELNAESIISHAFDGSIYVSESLLIFLFAGVGLDLCIKLGILYPFPIDPSITSSKDITTS
ncbi:hypothetical protein ABFS82_01G107900 [Erythranthe guttata]|uniref:Homer protein n=1 Tax=Erythranthe guttata TaxID=4155 RepID=A0A022RKH1_ERYGU|nr:PREDICTED: uncharacterized protein LOC105954332 [Erythranthe guttata]EYU40691.1 hypothetical protein MIMGU_mgv1a010426mg [Erythranthe guttata]|eukprot:XP_012833457.1 PREDICTED: uncharacterized protein LOC105954332 [Erythranthe guttata]